MTDEFDGWGLVWVLFFEMHDKAKGSIFERSVGWAYNDSIPDGRVVSKWAIGSRSGDELGEVTHHVITLSATGDADTPAGGSVCIRFEG